MKNEAPKIRLTPKRQACVDALCRGLGTEEIAAELGITRSTVLNHIKAVYPMLGVSTRHALVVKAVQLGLATIPKVKNAE